MPPSPRITFRLTPALEALVSDRVRHGGNVSDIVRDALETYFGLRQTGCPTSGSSSSDRLSATQETVSDGMSDRVTALVSDVSDLRERLGQLEARLDELSAPVRQRPTQTQGPAREMPQPSPQILGTYDPQAAAARIQTLRDQGLSLTRIAAILTEEGIPTRYGLPWQYSSVRHLLKTYGQ